MDRLHLTIEQLLAATGGRLLAGRSAAEREPALARIVIDSREARPGDLFWALPGSRLQGSEFVGDAWKRGAAGVVSTTPSPVPPGSFLILVDDAHEALRKLAEYRRQQFRGTSIAVTGSVGKTTTRQMIDTVLASRFHGVASQRNYNNHIGLPLTLARLAPTHHYGVFELGASASGEIAQLSQLCLPHMAVLTRIAESHLAGFGGFDSILRAKLEVLEALPADGLALVNGDCPHLRRATSGHDNIQYFGRGGDNHLVATDVTARRGWLRFRVERQTFAIPVWGRHFVSAALAAIGVGRAFGFSLAEMAEALTDFNPPDQRCEVEFLPERAVINDSYNACPTSMRAALELLRDFDADGRRVVVCGDMLELGSRSIEFHADLGREIVELCGADLLIACGQHSRHTAQAALRAGMPADRVHVASGVEQVKEVLGRELAPGDTILVKGSRATRMERVVQWLREEEPRPEPRASAIPLALVAA